MEIFNMKWKRLRGQGEHNIALFATCGGSSSCDAWCRSGAARARCHSALPCLPAEQQLSPQSMPCPNPLLGFAYYFPLPSRPVFMSSKKKKKSEKKKALNESNEWEHAKTCA